MEYQLVWFGSFYLAQSLKRHFYWLYSFHYVILISSKFIIEHICAVKEDEIYNTMASTPVKAFLHDFYVTIYSSYSISSRALYCCSDMGLDVFESL